MLTDTGICKDFFVQSGSAREATLFSTSCTEPSFIILTFFFQEVWQSVVGVISKLPAFKAKLKIMLLVRAESLTDMHQEIDLVM